MADILSKFRGNNQSQCGYQTCVRDGRNVVLFLEISLYSLHNNIRVKLQLSATDSAMNFRKAGIYDTGKIKK